MAALSGRLTKRLVENLPPGRHGDGAGLYLVVDPSGARRWIVRVTVKGQKNRKGAPLRTDFGLGGADVVTLNAARERALEYPKLKKQDNGEFNAECPPDFRIQDLMGMRTHDAAHGLYETAISAIGEAAEKHAGLVSAMFAEIEPQDAIEAMLVAQMTATHVTMTNLTARMSYQRDYQVREAYERSVTRLSRTFLAQMDALKKYRAKAQQTVRVERVNVESGGQAIVGDVSTGGRAESEK